MPIETFSGAPLSTVKAAEMADEPKLMPTTTVFCAFRAGGRRRRAADSDAVAAVEGRRAAAHPVERMARLGIVEEATSFRDRATAVSWRMSGCVALAIGAAFRQMRKSTRSGVGSWEAGEP